MKCNLRFILKHFYESDASKQTRFYWSYLKDLKSIHGPNYPVVIPDYVSVHTVVIANVLQHDINETGLFR